MKKLNKTAAIFIVMGVFTLAGAALIFFRKPVAIKYHKLRINVLLNKKPKFDPVSGFSFFDGDWMNALDKHRDKLVELAYFQRVEFPLSYISYPSLQSRRLWEELGSRFPNHPHAVMQGYEPNTIDMIIVWDQPHKLAECARVISAHDAPPTNIVDASQGKSEDLLRFVGHWAEEAEEACYIITEHAGTLKVETPPNDACRIVFKNIRLEGKRIAFDSFYYIDPNEDLKSIVNSSGEHPFSGVRCEMALEVNPRDPNELFNYNVSTVGRYGNYTAPNHSVLRKLK